MHLRWDKDYATYPFQSIDGLVTEFGGEELRAAIAQALRVDADVLAEAVRKGRIVVLRVREATCEVEELGVRKRWAAVDRVPRERGCPGP